MQVRHSHHGDGPQLQTSLPPTDPLYPLLMEKLSIYTALLYAKLVEYGHANYAPTTDGAYRDLFATPHGSPSRTTDAYVHGTPTPDEIANQGFNLLIKVKEHEGQLFLVVAPTANAIERNTLRQALDDTQRDWQALRGLGSPAPTGLKPAIVYHWPLDDTPVIDLWPDTVFRPQVETDIFHAPPQQ